MANKKVVLRKNKSDKRSITEVVSGKIKEETQDIMHDIDEIIQEDIEIGEKLKVLETVKKELDKFKSNHKAINWEDDVIGSKISDKDIQDFEAKKQTSSSLDKTIKKLKTQQAKQDAKIAADIAAGKPQLRSARRVKTISKSEADKIRKLIFNKKIKKRAGNNNLSKLHEERMAKAELQKAKPKKSTKAKPTKNNLVETTTVKKPKRVIKKRATTTKKTNKGGTTMKRKSTTKKKNVNTDTAPNNPNAVSGDSRWAKVTRTRDFQQPQQSNFQQSTGEFRSAGTQVSQTIDSNPAQQGPMPAFNNQQPNANPAQQGPMPAFNNQQSTGPMNLNPAQQGPMPAFNNQQSTGPMNLNPAQQGPMPAFNNQQSTGPMNLNPAQQGPTSSFSNQQPNANDSFANAIGDANSHFSKDKDAEIKKARELLAQLQAKAKALLGEEAVQNATSTIPTQIDQPTDLATENNLAIAHELADQEATLNSQIKEFNDNPNTNDGAFLNTNNEDVNAGLDKTDELNSYGKETIAPMKKSFFSKMFGKDDEHAIRDQEEIQRLREEVEGFGSNKYTSAELKKIERAAKQELRKQLINEKLRISLQNELVDQKQKALNLESDLDIIEHDKFTNSKDKILEEKAKIILAHEKEKLLNIQQNSMEQFELEREMQEFKNNAVLNASLEDTTAISIQEAEIDNMRNQLVEMKYEFEKRFSDKKLTRKEKRDLKEKTMSSDAPDDVAAAKSTAEVEQLNMQTKIHNRERALLAKEEALQSKKIMKQRAKELKLSNKLMLKKQEDAVMNAINGNISDPEQSNTIALQGLADKTAELAIETPEMRKARELGEVAISSGRRRVEKEIIVNGRGFSGSPFVNARVKLSRKSHSTSSSIQKSKLLKAAKKAELRLLKEQQITNRVMSFARSKQLNPVNKLKVIKKFQQKQLEAQNRKRDLLETSIQLGRIDKSNNESINSSISKNAKKAEKLRKKERKMFEKHNQILTKDIQSLSRTTLFDKR